jgi:aryl-alcohol dehydrogenase
VPSRRAPQLHCISAAVLRKPGGPLVIEALQMEGPRDDEVLVRLVASGICHTDIDLCAGGASSPVVLGHEGAGIVEKVGKAIRSVKRGDHVVLSYQSCGRCRDCNADRPAQCEHFWDLNFGFARLDGSNALAPSGVRGHFFGQSSFATHALATERNVVKVAKKLPLELLAPLGCGLQTGAATVINSLAVEAGASVTVFGTGSIGLAAVMAARIVGANPIIGVDIHAKRLALARELGATHDIRNGKTGVTKKIRAITSGGVDHVVESTGDAALYRSGLDLLNPRGSMALLAGGSSPVELPDGRKAFDVVQGDAAPQRFIAYLIRLYGQGRFPFDRLVTFYDFADINRAIADAKSGKTIKAVLRIGNAGSPGRSRNRR